MRLLDAYGVPAEGVRAVVVDRSDTFGKPMAVMLLNANATVSVCDLAAPHALGLVGAADLVVAAAGRPRWLTAVAIKAGATVIDAGYFHGSAGDVDTDSVAQRAAHLAPVPGGVGPMTIALLVEQTIAAAAQQHGIEFPPTDPQP
jgi:methylenetetrahydrofolate dehydrogenase (NADP+) / methenyltetrahydrofolate cyclohydrolase